jgi:hypothetical protein
MSAGVADNVLPQYGSLTFNLRSHQGKEDAAAPLHALIPDLFKANSTLFFLQMRFREKASSSTSEQL